MINAVRKATTRASKLLSRQGLYPFLRREFGGIPAGARILSVGAGGKVNELLQEYATERRFTVEQLDIDPDRKPDIVADLCEWRAEEPYDCIVLSEVLEHVHTPQAAIASIFASLRSGGTLILTAPFLFPIHDRPYDYYRYTRFGLAHLLRDFDAVDIRERNGWAESIGVLLARMSKAENRRTKITSPVFVLAAVAGFPLMWSASRVFHTDQLTTGYVVVARKPAH